MKKFILVTTTTLIILIIVLLLYKNTRTTLICTNQEQKDTYKMKSVYKIKFQKDKVLLLETKEEYTSLDTNNVDEHQMFLEFMYSKYKTLKYYDNNISRINDKVVTKTKINYDKINLSELKKVDSSVENIMKDNYISVKKIKKIYKNSGARCIYK